MARKKKSNGKTSKNKRKKLSLKLSKQQKVISGSFLILFGIALLFSFVSYVFTWQADQSILAENASRDIESKNWLSTFGAYLGHFFIYNGFGISSLIFSFLLTLTGVYYFFDFTKKQLFKFWFWGCLVMIWVAVFFGFFSSISKLYSGIIGFEINDILQDYLGFTGAILVMLFLFIVYLVVRLNITPDKVAATFKRTKNEIEADFVSEEILSENIVDEINTDTLETTSEEIDLTDNLVKTNNIDFPPLDEITLKTEVETPTPDSEVTMEVEKATEEIEVTKILSDKLVSDFGEFDPRLELSKYKFPTIDLLKDYAKNAGITINQEELEENKNKIVSTLSNYKIGIASIKAKIGRAHV